MARGEWQEFEGLEAQPRSNDEIGRFEAFLDKAIVEIGSFVTDARRGPATGEGAERADHHPEPRDY
jgi:hypothetical protein